MTADAVQPELPGLGLPLNYRPDTPFPSAVMDWANNTPTLREASMYWFVNTITDKPDWEEKVFDDEIVAKWRAEVDDFATRGGAEATALEDAHNVNDPPVVFPPISRGFSDEMFSYCLQELRDKARIAKESNGFVSLFDGAAAVVKSDRAIPANVKAGFRALAAKLEDVPNCQRDWHPGSDEKVLDLVHPSLWPLVYGKTRVLATPIALEDCLGACGSGTTIEVPPKPEGPGSNERLYSTKFQWLPAEVDIGADGTATFASYINNLHPTQHAADYTTIEGLVTAALPALDAVYVRSIQWHQLLAVESGYELAQKLFICRSRIQCNSSSRACSTPQICETYCCDGNRPDNVDPPADGETVWGANMRWFAATHPVNQPEPLPYSFLGVDNYRREGGWFAPVPREWEENVFAVVAKEWKNERVEMLTKQREEREKAEVEEREKAEERDMCEDNADEIDVEGEYEDEDPELGDREAQEAAIELRQLLSTADPEPIVIPEAPLGQRRIQIIVKLANIHLTPEKPSYDGGSWHIEGQLNEAICATALYYYDSENVTESRLGFRSVCDAEGFSEGAFLYEQSDHEPFRMLFGQRPGMDEDKTELPLGDVVTREDRLLVFPNVYRHRVAPFQLADKTKPGHRKIVALFLVDPAARVISTAHVPPQQLHWGSIPAVDSRLPAEIAQMVYSGLECPFSLAEAKRLRGELIDERKAIDTEVDAVIAEGQWCFCEH